MSSGATIPYHLRQNKAIDRNLFIDLLARIGRYRNISDYKFVGFGGAFLEDFKQLHASLRIEGMVSLERSEIVAARQKFNQPYSGVVTLKKTSGEYLNECDFEEQTIVWFDYTTPAELAIQLSEVELLVRKLYPDDIFKVTFNASTEPLGKPGGNVSIQEFRLARLLERAGVYAPAGLDADDVTYKWYPRTLLRCIESAAKRGMDTKPRSIIEPLAAFSYADGQQMVTFTGIILDRQDREPFLTSTRLRHWPFRCSGWGDLTSISVPQFSAKERMYIESRLPGETNAKQLIADLGYYVGDDETEGEELMSNFVRYYRMYPWYSRVMI
jgi:hypothetical protein